MLLYNLESVVLLIQALERTLLWEYEEVLQVEALAGIQTKCSAKFFCFLDLESRMCKVLNEFVVGLDRLEFFFPLS